MRKLSLLILLGLLSIFLIGCNTKTSQVSELPKIPALYIPHSGSPSPEDVAYELNTTPQLPNSAMVLKFKQPNITENDVRQLAQKFTLNGEIKYEPRNGVYNIKDGAKLLWVETKTGKWSFQNQSKAYSNGESIPNIPTDEEAKVIALQQVQNLDLPVNEFKVADVTKVTEEGAPGQPVKVLSKAVFLYRQINNQSILGVSRIIVMVGDNGEVVGVSKFYKEAEPFNSYPLKTFEKAYEELRSGAASSNIPGKATNAKINNVELRYWEDAGAISEQPYLQPVYVFKGETTIDGKIETFDAIVPAIEGSSIEPPVQNDNSSKPPVIKQPKN